MNTVNGEIGKGMFKQVFKHPGPQERPRSAPPSTYTPRTPGVPPWPEGGTAAHAQVQGVQECGCGLSERARRGCAREVISRPEAWSMIGGWRGVGIGCARNLGPIICRGGASFARLQSLGVANAEGRMATHARAHCRVCKRPAHHGPTTPAPWRLV